MLILGTLKPALHEQTLSHEQTHARSVCRFHPLYYLFVESSDHQLARLRAAFQIVISVTIS